MQKWERTARKILGLSATAALPPRLEEMLCDASIFTEMANGMLHNRQVIASIIAVYYNIIRRE